MTLKALWECWAATPCAWRTALPPSPDVELSPHHHQHGSPHRTTRKEPMLARKNQLPCPNFNCFFLLMHSLHTTFAPNTARCTSANSRVGTNSGLEENEQMINSAEWRLRRRPKAQHSGAQETWCTVLLHFESTGVVVQCFRAL